MNVKQKPNNSNFISTSISSCISIYFIVHSLSVKRTIDIAQVLSFHHLYPFQHSCLKFIERLDHKRFLYIHYSLITVYSKEAHHATITNEYTSKYASVRIVTSEYSLPTSSNSKTRCAFCSVGQLCSGSVVTAFIRHLGGVEIRKISSEQVGIPRTPSLWSRRARDRKRMECVKMRTKSFCRVDPRDSSSAKRRMTATN